MSSPPPEKPKKQGLLLSSHRQTVESTRGMSPAILLGSSFAIVMGIFAWLGHQWDEKTGNAPWGVLAGVALGFAYGAYEVWKLVKFSDQAAQNREGEKKKSPSDKA
ncbi:MAG: AtpZ/AtpI family protein [Kiritimatiellae bacterium]|jgi:F0F1-type ATP synthase assembly protein I|nr:AtpZ/AtpI family protein [Kiritimatiellia bacterium]